MSDQWLTSLLVLQDRDLKCDNFRKQLEAVPFEIQKEEQAISREREALDSARKELRELVVRREAAEGEIDSLEASVVRYKTQQMQVKKNEEYSALQHEIENHQAKVGEQEDIVLALMDEIETKEEQYRQLEAETNERIQVLEGHIARLRESEESYRQDLRDAETELEAARSGVAEDVAKAYAFVKGQVKRGPYVVELEGGNRCSGCHLKVSGEVESTARRGKERVRCDNCGRMVFFVR